MNSQRPTILCVDDKQENLKLLENILVPRGNTVVNATSGAAALLKIKSQPIDLVLLDVSMPGMDGFEVCRQIKADPKLRNIPVIMITALTYKQGRIRGIEAGAEEFLSKPIDQTEMLARMNLLLKVKELNDDREHVEEALQKSNAELDSKVQERTVELAYANALLKADITERIHAEEKIQRQLEHLTALSTIDQVIASNFDLKLCLSEILIHVATELAIDAADILILNPISQILEFAAERGFCAQAIRNRQVRMGEGFAGMAALDRQLVAIPNLKDHPENFLLTKLLAGEDFICYYGVPLIVKGQVKGVLEVFHRAALEPDAEWLDFLKALAGRTAIAIDNATLFDGLQRSNTELALAYDATIEGWSRALDLRDKETEGHTQRVTEMAVKLARAFGLSEAELVQVRWGALLHDIGKMGIVDGILLKPGTLTDEEWVEMKKHPTVAYELLSPVRYLRQALDIPYHHHEKWDGTGYPLGLHGEEIPLTARMFAVVDVWDALRSDRPYRKAWDEEKVRAHIGSLAGTHFDPQVVEVFLKTDWGQDSSKYNWSLDGSRTSKLFLRYGYVMDRGRK
jgi:putative nucleotidyltransferase with HDIG domain